jgi:putative membrane protein
MLKKKTIVGTGAAFFAVPAAMVLACGPAFAGSSGDVLVSNTETIQAYLDANGHVDTTRVYEQVAMQGKGTVDLSNPVETNGLRNLDGFGGFQVKNGNMVGTYTVDGEKRLRSVSDYTKRLPLKVDVSYTLDGKTVKPGDVVGRSGILKVQYTVTNMTGQTQTVSFDDGTGKTTTASEEVVIPIVGSLSTVLPSTFTDVKSGEANIAGDGRGGTKMSFTMTLFGPIGKPQATFGYEARITDGVVPKASISALPVSPLDSPSFKGGAESYKGGAETGSTLTAGATEIDSNLLKLRDGAGDLLAGLIKLRDGADQLSTGLTGQAAPGAKALATGAGRLKDGTSQLKDGALQAKDGSSQVAGGAGQVADGAGQLDGGAKQVDDGVGQLLDGLTQAGEKAPALLDGLSQVADGLDQVDGGLAQLYGGIGQLPEKAKPLHEGIAKLRAGLGSTTDAGTLIYGVNAVRTGLQDTALPGIQNVIDGLYSTSQSEPGAYQKLGCAQVILTDVVAGTVAPLGGNGRVGTPDPCYYDAVTNPQMLVPFLKGLTDTANAGGPGVYELSKTVTTKVRDNIKGALPGIVADPTKPTVPNGTTLVGGLEKLKLGLDAHKPGTLDATDPGGALYALASVQCGLSNESLPGACDAKKPGLLEGLSALDDGVDLLVKSVVTSVQSAVGTEKDLPDGDRTTLRGGIHGLQGGVDLIGAGGVTLIDGLYQLGDGAALLKDGTSQLADGTRDLRAGADQLSDGAGQLDSGLGDLSTGAGKLDAGAGDLRTGADQLSSGLGDAADGSSQLADGLKKAAGGAPALKDGAQKLSDEGTKKLVAAGKSTAADYGQKYALIVAGAERAKSEGMAYGAPADAVGNTAYSYELAGADGEGGRNVGRGVAAFAAFGLAGGAAFLRRRFI